ncbi:hypothetical protein V5O48_016117 [Marasmius crinis-equi]|uniref:Uncharacterized protein n=1 Tax=Marasmius crinis-equi TaxID=585013 RepID=A0ABR3ESM8_9AGAR
MESTYGMKQHYFADMFYQGGVCLIKEQNDDNCFNAYKSVRAHERKEAGETPLHLTELQELIKDGYKALTSPQQDIKKKIVQVALGLEQIVGIIQGLKTCLGVEAMLLMTKNRQEPFMQPQWFTTDPRIHDYMSFLLRGWDPVEIGHKFEGFAIAGCDAIKLIKSQKDQAEAAKRLTPRLVQKALDGACGTQGQAMHYEKFDTLITATYKVKCEGWPKGLKFQCPSDFGGSLEPLIRLHNAWATKTAYFRKMDDEEFQQWEIKHAEEYVPKEWKKRSNAGIPRKNKDKQQAKDDEDEQDSEDEMAVNPKQSPEIDEAVGSSKSSKSAAIDQIYIATETKQAPPPKPTTPAPPKPTKSASQSKQARN